MHIIKWVMMLGVSLGCCTQANKVHANDISMSLQRKDKSLHHPVIILEDQDQALQKPSHTLFQAQHHLQEHGGQIYSTIKLKTAWVKVENQDQVLNHLDTWVGTDEQKIALKIQSIKMPSQQLDWDAKLLYQHAISIFWDLEAGIKYMQHADQKNAGMLWGIHGVAPYFFETDATVYLSDQEISLNVEAVRDILITQKWIAQPHLEADWKIYQRGKAYRGDRQDLAKLMLGLENRYEVTKQFMPFIDVAYQYEPQQQEGIKYGVGVRFLF